MHCAAWATMCAVDHSAQMKGGYSLVTISLPPSSALGFSEKPECGEA